MMTPGVTGLHPESRFPLPHAWIDPLGSNGAFGVPESGPTARTLCAASGDGLSTLALAAAPIPAQIEPRRAHLTRFFRSV